MDKLKMQSMDKVQGNIEKIKELFPNTVTEVLRDGKPMLAVDFDVLKQELADTLIDERELRYQFTWPDKQKSVLLANTPINKTLRPCKEESVDFDNTQNLYIEGDNLEVLKLLQETYLGKIKMIYIDPPYNTGNDFVYNDDFSQDSDKYTQNSGQFDEQGNRLVQNTESNGRFHTDWLNMIYPRLRLAKDLLSDDGVIFISIDDNEVDNLKKVCNEIFGESNFIANIVWQSTVGSNTGENVIITVTENILCYAKSSEKTINKEKFVNDGKMRLQDEYFAMRGYYALDKLDSMRQASHYSEALNYAIECPDGTLRYPGGKNYKQDKWNYLWSKSKVEWGIKSGFIVFKQVGNEWAIYNKRYELVDNSNNKTDRGSLFKNLVLSSYCTTATGSKDIQSVFDNNAPFDYPKPIKLISKFCELGCNRDSIVLDFFSGSATTAHAVMQLNAEDSGNRKFIMVQLPEVCDEKSEAYKAGYKNICEIGKERIRRAGKKIKEELGLRNEGLDTGFRVLKLDSSNMKDVYYKPEQYTQSLLSAFEDNIKEDRSPLDLLFQVMLELGKPLSAKIEQKELGLRNQELETIAPNSSTAPNPYPLTPNPSYKIFIVDDNDLIACFDNNITDEVVKAIAQLKPLYAVFRDSSLSNDSTAVNFDQIFATYSPNTTRKVL